MIKQYIFLKRNRLRKKGKLYKQVLQLTFDITTFFYVLLLIGYIATAIAMEGNIKEQFQAKMIQFEAFTIERFWLIITVLPFMYLIRSFQQPGVIFSTAEYTLTILPHSKLQVFRVTVIERWLKALGMYLMIGFIIAIFSPTSMPLILTYILLLFGLNVLTTIPGDRKSTRLNSSHVAISYAVFCLKKKR